MKTSLKGKAFSGIKKKLLYGVKLTHLKKNHYSCSHSLHLTFEKEQFRQILKFDP